MAGEVPFWDTSKEFLAVSSITNEIKCSVHSYLLSASPRSDVGSQPSTPAAYQRQHVVLSPWNGCVGASLENCSPLSACATPPLAASPELGPGVTLPQPTGLRFPMHCSLSPTRNRFHSPKATAALAPEDGSFVFDLKSIPDLEEDSGRSSSSSSSPGPSSSVSSSSGTSSPDSRLDLEGLGSLHGQGLFGASAGSVPDQLNLYPGFKFTYSGRKPPLPPRQSGKRLFGKTDASSGMLRVKTKCQQGAQDGSDKFMISLISVVLLLLFVVLVIYGGPTK